MAFDISWVQTLATATFGAGLAFGAARFERGARRQEDDRRMLLGKAEQTFSALARFEAGSAQFMIDTVKRIGDDESSVEKTNASLEPVETLIRLYFPQVEHHVDEFIAAEKALASRFSSDLDAATKLPNAKTANIALAHYSMARAGLISALGKKLRPAIREAVPALKNARSTP